MRYIIFIILLVAVLITVGCTSENQNSDATPTPQIVTTIVSTPVPTTAISTNIQIMIDNPIGHASVPTVAENCSKLGGIYFNTINGVDYCKVIKSYDADIYTWVMVPADGSPPPRLLDKSINGTINIVTPAFHGDCIIKVDDKYYGEGSPGERMQIFAPEGKHSITFYRKSDGSFIAMGTMQFMFGQQKNYDFSNA